MKVYCDPLGDFVQLPEKPLRIVSLVAGLTETLVQIGSSHLIAGISEFCPRFTPQLTAPVIGDYLIVDMARLRAVEPDLILATTGIQRGLAQRLHKEGFPVYVLPLPNSLHGILENVLTLGALVDDLPAARALAQRWEQLFLDLKVKAPDPKPRVYAELWLGRHVRMAGGLTFVNDLIEAAGGENVFGDVRTGYLPLDLPEMARRRPDIFLCFSEPEYPVQATALQQERGWTFQTLQADITPSHNIIHDGPSMMEAARWLRHSLQAIWDMKRYSEERPRVTRKAVDRTTAWMRADADRTSTQRPRAPYAINRPRSRTTAMAALICLVSAFHSMPTISKCGWFTGSSSL